MNQANFPEPMTLRELLKPLLLARDQLKHIEKAFGECGEDKLCRRGLFVLMVAAVETMLASTLQYFLTLNPHKLEFRDLTFKRDDILGSPLTTDLLARRVEKLVRDKGYASLQEVVEFLLKTLRIMNTPVPTELMSRIEALKKKRNDILHLPTALDNFYVDARGQLKESSPSSQSTAHNVSYQYGLDALCSLHDLLRELERRIRSKYGDHTKVRALKAIWYHLFSSPLMQFEDYWIVDDEKDTIKAFKRTEHESQLSLSEKMFLGIWRAHFSGNLEGLSRFSMKALDKEHAEKLIQFLRILRTHYMY